MNATVLTVIFGLLFASLQVSGFLGTDDCEHSQCMYRRGHFRISTSQKSPQSKAFGRDLRTMYVTKDYRTRFDVVFFIKNIKNFDVRMTQFGLAAYKLGTNLLNHVTMGSSRDKVVYFKDVTSVQLSLVSYQDDTTFDIYYFMDCGFKMDQNLSFKYPEPPEPVNPVIETWDRFFQAPGAEEERKKTCWFMVPLDNYQGFEKVESTYVIIRNTSLADGVTINVVDLIRNRTVTTFPEIANDIEVSHIPGHNFTAEVGWQSHPVTTVLYVELSCPARYLKICKKRSNFEILFKPLVEDDINCILVEEKCRYGSGLSSHLCKPEDKLPEGADKTITGKYFTTSRCSAFNDLLNTVKESKTRVGAAQRLSSAERMGMRGMCGDFDTYCTDIRRCSSQGECADICMTMNMRGICENF